MTTEEVAARLTAIETSLLALLQQVREIRLELLEG